MKRTQIYISDHLQEKLDKLSKSRDSSKSAIIREAIEEYFERRTDSERMNKLRKGAGLWKHKTDVPDIAPLRKELDRIS